MGIEEPSHRRQETTGGMKSGGSAKEPTGHAVDPFQETGGTKKVTRPLRETSQDAKEGH